MKLLYIFLIFLLTIPQFLFKNSRKHHISLRNIPPKPAKNTLILDPDSLLLSKDKAYFNEKLRDFTKIKVIIWIVKEISPVFPNKNKGKHRVFRNFLEKVQKKWNFQGILLFIAAKEAKIHLFANKNLNKTYINSNFSAKIRKFIEPLLRKKDFSKAIDRAINELNAEFSQNKDENIHKIKIMLLGFAIFIVFMAIIKPKTPKELEKPTKKHLKKEKFL